MSAPAPLAFRAADARDVDAMHAIHSEAAASGDTLSARTPSTREAFATEWLDPEWRTFVAEDERGIVGFYIVGANQPGRGAHVANATFLVEASARGRGIGRALVRHCIDEARGAGYAAIQFNFVVATNVAALALYESLGFHVVGRLPGAFDHARLGPVDALVLFKSLA